MRDLTPGIILAVLGITLYKILELYARRKERLNLIEKLSESNTDLKASLSLRNESTFSALKIGALLCGAGFGCLVSVMIQIAWTDSFSSTYDHFGYELKSNIRDIVGAIYFAGISAFGGLGLVIAYLIEKKDKQNKQ